MEWHLVFKTAPTKPLHHSENEPTIYKGWKMVIGSGGTLSSPLILQKSGIGNPEELRKVRVRPLVDLPAVGNNFQDHYLAFSLFLVKPDSELFHDLFQGDPEVQKRVFNEWNIKGIGPLATNGIDAGVKMRPTEELQQMEKGQLQSSVLAGRVTSMNWTSPLCTKA